jgi:outer membrane receptor protein involved in Fe transport
MNSGMKTSVKKVLMGMAAVMPFFFQTSALAQEMEEVIVQARLKSGAEALVSERMDDAVVSDILGAEMIGRTGDSTVASALRRVAGLSLVGGKFVYIRGLGERYSSSTLNGSSIPSPDLTRNVIPLDIFPTAIVESLRVQKAYSADKAASFGGGSVDIRTKGIPDQFTYSIEATGDVNSELNGDVFSYAGGGDDRGGQDDGARALSGNITSAIGRFTGNLDAQNILNALRKEGNPDATILDARVVNRDLAINLNRDISITPESASPNLNLRGTIGNNFYLTDDLEAGFLIAGSYGTQWRETSTLARDFTFPEQRFEREVESTYTVNLNANVNFGIRYTDDHEISSTSLYIRNTDDEVQVIDFFNADREKSDGIGFREERIIYEERALIVNQLKGSHRTGAATKELWNNSFLKFIPLHVLPDETEVSWIYSESRAMTSIPNEVYVSSNTVTDVLTGDVLSSDVITDSAAADYRFTDLDDNVIHYGWQFTVPFETASSFIEVSAGSDHAQKSRTYRQSQFSLGALDVADSATLAGALSNVFSTANITDPANNYVFNLTGTNNQSYLAATMTDAVFGMIDWTWNDKWRIGAGARWENYRQVALDWNIYGYTTSSPQISNDPVVLANGTFSEDNIYPSVSVTYIGDLWAEVFQLRFGWSQTVVRPDLREITDASYIDARTGFLTDGNPTVRPADITNFDIRAEWFFSSGDNLTASAFFKDIENPIEFFESAASDTNRAREIINAESAQVAGVELEGLKDLAFLGSYGETLFLQGNLTIQDSELVAGIQADAPTNNVRKITGASDYVANIVLGFDSLAGAHAATISYNVFGERIYVAGRNGAPDGEEQPFHSLDMTYSWYPTESITLKLKVQNLLDEAVTIERAGVETFEEKPGTTASISLKWQL